MNITLETRTPATIETQALVTYVFDGRRRQWARRRTRPGSEVLRRLAESGAYREDAGDDVPACAAGPPGGALACCGGGEEGEV